MTKLYDKMALNRGLVLDLPLYDASLGSVGLVLDRSLYHNNGTVLGATWGSQGRIFDGDDLITTSAFPSLTDNFTLIIWVKDSVASGDYIGNSRTSYYGFRFNASVNSLDFATQQLGTFQTSRVAGAVTTNVWSQFAVTLATPNALMYKNGGSLSLTTTGTHIAASSSALPLTIGRNAYAVGAFFTGTIGEVLIFSRALSQPEIQNIYQQTKWRYV